VAVIGQVANSSSTANLSTMSRLISSPGPETPLKLVEGDREVLERELVRALFGPGNDPVIPALLARLERRGGLQAVPRESPAGSRPRACQHGNSDGQFDPESQDQDSGK
jgi:hypothetical protein